jgi:type II secretory pathway component PulJ
LIFDILGLSDVSSRGKTAIVIVLIVLVSMYALFDLAMKYSLSNRDCDQRIERLERTVQDLARRIDGLK